jgi:hypothetical protein
VGWIPASVTLSESSCPSSLVFCIRANHVDILQIETWTFFWFLAPPPLSLAKAAFVLMTVSILDFSLPDDYFYL